MGGFALLGTSRPMNSPATASLLSGETAIHWVSRAVRPRVSPGPNGLFSR